jgi:putative transposase
MGRKRTHTPEETVAKLRQVEVLTAQGKTVSEAVRTIGVTHQTLDKVILKEAASEKY